MRRIMAFAALAATVTLNAATYRQASQAWVELKMAQMEARIVSSISAASAATNKEDSVAIIQASTTRSISDGYAIANNVIGSSAGVPTNGVPFWIIGNVSSSITNAIPRGEMLWMASNGIYTNAAGTVTLTEGYAWNTISATGLGYDLGTSPSDNMFTKSGDDTVYAIATRFFK